MEGRYTLALLRVATASLQAAGACVGQWHWVPTTRAMREKLVFDLEPAALASTDKLGSRL